MFEQFLIRDVLAKKIVSRIWLDF